MLDHALTAPDPHRLARAFLALGDDDAAAAPPHSPTRALAALVAVIAIALAPVTWLGPPARALGSKAAGQPTATLGSPKAVLPPADDDEGAPA
jgi:hypothetical protein